MNAPQKIEIGEITLEDLKLEMENKNFIPFWQMHPITQNVMRCFAHHRPQVVEEICDDNDDWKPLRHRDCQMFFESYRIKPEHFDEIFVLHFTNFLMWKYRNKKRRRVA